MEDPRKQLEDVTFQWFDDDISDEEYIKYANKYLKRRNYRLYKYQNPFVSLESLNTFRDLLKTNKLSLCAPSTFNDPFDGQFTVPDWADSRIPDCMRETTDEIWRIGCLTEHNDSLLMWAHYGASYRGVCIEYDFSNFSAPENDCIFAPVMYRESRPEVPGSVITNMSTHRAVSAEDKKQLSKGLFTKNLAWKYEYEWRIVKGCPKDKRNSLYLPFDIPPIRKIYLGAEWRTNYSDSDGFYHNLREICEQKKIDIIETHLNDKSYTVDIL